MRYEMDDLTDANKAQLLGDLRQWGMKRVRKLRIAHGYGPGYALSWDGRGIVTIEHSESDSTLDGKWTRRPITDEQANRLLGLLTDVLSQVTNDTVSARDTSVPLGGSRTINLEFDANHTSPTLLDFSRPKEELEWLYEEFARVFSSITPPNASFKDELRHLCMIEHREGSLLGEITNSVIVLRGPASGTYRMVRKVVRFPPSQYGERQTAFRDIPFEEDDWHPLLDALEEANLPNWGSVYRHFGVFDGWWTRLELLFDDGWGMSIMGQNRWDSRFLCIAKELAKHDEDLISQAQWFEPQEGSVEECLATIRNTTPGHVATLQLTSEEGTAYTWQTRAGLIRMRAFTEGFFVDDLKLSEDFESYPRRASHDKAVAITRVSTEQDVVSSDAPQRSPEVEEAIRQMKALLMGVVAPPLPTDAEGVEEGASSPESAVTIWPQSREPVYKAEGVIRPIRAFPFEDCDVTLKALKLHLNVNGIDMSVRYDSDRASVGSLDEGRAKADRHMLKSALLQIDGVTWNDPETIVREGCVIGLSTRNELTAPRGRFWYVEAIWDDESVSFATGPGILRGASALYEALMATQLRDSCSAS